MNTFFFIKITSEGMTSYCLHPSNSSKERISHLKAGEQERIVSIQTFQHKAPKRDLSAGPF